MKLGYCAVSGNEKGIDPVALGEKIVADMREKRKALGWD